MFELNTNGTKAIMPINDMANICGYFKDTEHVNNGYGCSHSECGDKQNGIGCCLPCNCPLGWESDEEDCEEFGIEYDDGEYIVTDNQEILDKLSESE